MEKIPSCSFHNFLCLKKHVRFIILFSLSKTVVKVEIIFLK